MDLRLNPPRQIWCVGRNYLDHAKEMNSTLPKHPLIFLKAGSCFVAPETEIMLPKNQGEIHHELELAFRIENKTFSHVGLALDLTARDVQAQLKKEGLPWTLAKSFIMSCPVSRLKKMESLKKNPLSFELRVNAKTRQLGISNEMIFSPQELLAYIQIHFPVQDGDLLLTGTPAGVSALAPGDHLEVFLESECLGTWQTI